MESESKCPSCGKALPPNAPHGLCPACLVKAGMPTIAINVPETFKLPDAGELARLFPQLEILELLGHGGMGAVYKARQPALDRMVALKILAPKVQNDPGFAERFNREAKALARLCHPHIVAIYDFGLAGNMHYFIMEFVEGGNLRELQQAGRFSPQEALKIIPQICEALQYAHDQGVVHRDIKPENVMLDKKGRVKIADFGLAKITGLEPAAFRLTGAKDVMGTPHYMAPEQVEHPQEVDHRADIYSLGVVFYEMLTGELPLGRFAPPSRKVQVDVRLDEVVLHTLEKEPTRRYQHASQVGKDVEAIAGSPEEARKKAVRPGTPAAVLGPAVTICRWIARVFSVLLLLFYSYFILGEGLPAIGGQPVGVRLNFVALGLMMAGFAFGFKREGTAAILISTGWALWQGVESHFDFNFLQAPIGVGLLYAFCWWATRRKATAHVVAWAAGLMLFLVIVRLFIPANIFLRGVVSDRVTGRPIRNAEISAGQAVPDGVVPNARTRADGHYNLYVGWHSAKAPLKISASGYETLATTLGSRKPGQKLVERNFDLSPLQEPPLEAALMGDLMRLPPVVISTSPQAGSQEVDPNTSMIRVTFSTPMLDGNWSWVKTDAKTFPELTGEPYYSEDRRTCLLPVRLKPSSTYVMWLNVDEFTRFRGTNGEPAVTYLLVFKTR